MARLKPAMPRYRRCCCPLHCSGTTQASKRGRKERVPTSTTTWGTRAPRRLRFTLSETKGSSLPRGGARTETYTGASCTRACSRPLILNPSNRLATSDSDSS